MSTFQKKTTEFKLKSIKKRDKDDDGKKTEVGMGPVAGATLSRHIQGLW